MTEVVDKRANLAKLAAYLEALPADYEHFEMQAFVDNRISRRAELHYGLNNGGIHTCGTAGCAVGHGPAAGIYFTEDEFQCTIPGYEQLDWSLYTDRNFIDCNSNDFEWMFASDWSRVDNTPHGAAARIRYYLRYGVPEQYAAEGCWADEAVVELYAPFLVKGDAGDKAS